MSTSPSRTPPGKASPLELQEGSVLLADMEAQRRRETHRQSNPNNSLLSSYVSRRFMSGW
jgi:hypothetical protein